MSNKLYKTITLVMLVMAMLGFSLISNDLWSSKVDAEEVKNVITVNGRGSITAKPDIAYVSMGVDTIGSTANQTQKKNAAVMNKLIKTLKNMGIDKDDIKTTDYNIYTEQDYDKNTKKNAITGYQVSNTMEVTVRDVNNVGNVIDKAGEAGANKMYNIRFAISDDSSYYQQALNIATKNAESKAKAIAKGLGVDIIGPVKVTEQSTGGPVLYKNLDGKMMLKEAAADTSVFSGELEVKAEITIGYSY